MVEIYHIHNDYFDNKIPVDVAKRELEKTAGHPLEWIEFKGWDTTNYIGFHPMYDKEFIWTISDSYVIHFVKDNYKNVEEFMKECPHWFEDYKMEYVEKVWEIAQTIEDLNSQLIPTLNVTLKITEFDCTEEIV